MARDDYYEDDKKKRENVERQCLECGRTFIADGRYIRLCDLHRKDCYDGSC